MKQSLKALADGTATLVVFPAFLLYRLGRLALGPEKAFPGWSQAFSLIPGLTGVYLRRAFYRLTLARCGAGACISFGTVFSHPTAEVGRDVYVGPFCGLGDVTLGDDALLGSHVSIMNGGSQHGIGRLDIPIREQPGSWRRVTVGRDTWVGDRAVVLADVGEQCVIGAGSVVNRPVPDRAIAVGVPAKVIRYRQGAGSTPAPAGAVPPAPGPEAEAGDNMMPSDRPPYGRGPEPSAAAREPLLGRMPRA
jgi:acetyltransferase-like isoleucine patch superfamily enzyme